MNKALQDKLNKDFPILYRGRHLSVRENLMPFGFEVGNGWFKLIYELSEKIVDLAPLSIVTQVKEKYGTLRFYIDLMGGKDEDYNKVWNYIDEADTASFTICENCGNPGTVSNEGWVRVRCEPCAYRREIMGQEA